ncbi:4Fe-4S binding protein [Anaerocellum danielii]|uniref:4Fe-4S binding protein n=1 Tax=Anaerocellum danielii TaxID=1387557 RepID=A0ABZ0U5C1_9FIRM|nr:4Fe-4S binding protein [Caldicellulosiruptor danielii]WPX09793.1 4Fe-4S binding protein [Caldicellulosiruptor danielii]
MFGMLKNVFVNLFSKPATRLYPKEKRPFFKDTRGSLEIEIEKCIFCGICQRKCPSNAIVVDRNSRTWQLNQYKCVLCNVCVESCPKKCLISKEQFNVPTTYKEFYIKKQEVKDEVQPKAQAAATNG